MAALAFFLASFSWNYALGMTWLAVPLYAYSLGLSGAEIGLLFAVPSFAQAGINLVGGAYVDRMGGRRVMLASSLLMAAGAALVPLSQGFGTLLVSQLVLALARATFWPANWSIAAELPGSRGQQTGRLNAIANLAHIVGNSACGFLLAAAGFALTFAALAGTALAAFGLAFFAPRGAHRTASTGSLFGNYRVLATMPVIRYGMLCAYLAALPFSLAMSFYPILLKHLGYGEEGSGVLLALRSVGGIAAGLVVARFVRSGPASPWPAIAGGCVAAGVMLQPLFGHWAAVGLLLLSLGVGSTLLTVYFQVTMAEVVKPEMRGSAMALGGLGWGVSHLSTPLVTGFLADRYGVDAGFYALGALSLAVVGLIAGLRRWAFAATPLAAGDGPGGR